MFAIVDGRAGTLGAADAVTEVGAAVDTAGGAEEIESTAVAPPRSHGFGGDGIIAVDEGIERKTRRLAVSGDPESRWLVKRHTHVTVSPPSRQAPGSRHARLSWLSVCRIVLDAP